MTDTSPEREETSAPFPAEGEAPGQGPYSPAYTRYVLFMLLLVAVFNNIDRTILSILVEPIKAEFELSDTAMGAAMGVAFVLVYTATALPVASWAEFGVRRSIIAGGVFVWSLFTAATFWVQSYGQLFLMRMGVGIGEAAGTPPSLSLLSDYLPRSRRGRGVSVIPIGAVTGMGIGMVAGGFINEAYGWRLAFLAAGLPGILLAVLVRFSVREPVRGGSEPRGHSAQPATLREAFRYLLGLRTFQVILLANAFANFASMGRNLWEPSFLIRTYEMGTGAAGLWYFLTSPLPSMLGIYLGGRFADRLGARDPRWYLWVPAVGQTLSVPILVAFLLWPESDRVALPAFMARLGAPDIPVALLFSIVGSVFSTFFTAPFLASIQNIAKLRMRAMAAAISTAVSSFVGLCAGPLLVGVVSDAFRSSYGSDALRYSLLLPTLAPLLSAAVCVLGTGGIRRDLREAARDLR
ncbi:MAG: MFS transporter [Myxococcota bacterium]